MTDEPFLRVVSGTPTPEELAAIVGVLWARRQASGAAAGAASARVHRSGWRASAAPRAGRLPTPGPGAWFSAR
jgi:hypothetical protein